MTESLRSVFELNSGGHPYRLNELHLAGLAIVGITAVYLTVVAVLGVPAAGQLFGHSLGIMGFGLMLATETLYSFRKRTLRKSWGRMSDWLRFHIFTGVVGPYLVLLHSAWSFNGLAGLVLLMTGLVVASGFFGRYVYTAVPRPADGVMVEEAALRREIARSESALRMRATELGLKPTSAGGAAGGLWGLFSRGPSDLAFELKRAWQRRRLGPQLRAQTAELDALVKRRREIQRQIGLLRSARQVMSVWHSIHIPMGLVLFILAFVHIGAAIYYATLLK
jgi:hypothetical protein